MVVETTGSCKYWKGDSRSSSSKGCKGEVTAMGVFGQKILEDRKCSWQWTVKGRYSVKYRCLRPFLGHHWMSHLLGIQLSWLPFTGETTPSFIALTGTLCGFPLKAWQSSSRLYWPSHTTSCGSLEAVRPPFGAAFTSRGCGKHTAHVSLRIENMLASYICSIRRYST